MVGITLDIAEEIERRVRDAPAARGISVCRFVAGLIERRVARGWPDEVAALAGAWPDLPGLDTLRSERAEDVARSSL